MLYIFTINEAIVQRSFGVKLGNGQWRIGDYQADYIAH